MKVKDIPANYNFVSNIQEVESIKEMIGKSKEIDIHALFVDAQDGEFVAVYGLKRVVPYLDELVHKLL